MVWYVRAPGIVLTIPLYSLCEALSR